MKSAIETEDQIVARIRAKVAAIMAPCYLGIGGVADTLGVKPDTLTKWLERHPGRPEPDATVHPGRRPGRPDELWLPGREEEWEAWRATFRGQGRSGRPRKTSAKETR